MLAHTGGDSAIFAFDKMSSENADKIHSYHRNGEA